MKLFSSLRLFACCGPRVHMGCIILCFILVGTSGSYGQRSEPFLFNCVVPGQEMKIDAIVSGANTYTNYHWQYKTPSGSWTCFTEGVNAINGTDFPVSGATKIGGANDAPLLTIGHATMALDNVMVRLLMGGGSDPCIVTSPVWGGDDQGKQDTKYLRLHVFGSQNECPPNSYSCSGNKISDGADYYGGFENVAYNTGTGIYTRKNFGANYASSDLAFGSSAGRYQDINNPYAMNSGFYRDIAPHSGNYQLVVSGPQNTTSRAWYKNNIDVIPGAQYRFALWVARIDNTDPVISLKVTAGATTTTVVSYDMFPEPVGTWKLVQGNYFVPMGTNQVDISVIDTQTGGSNNYSLDDICFRECFNCGTLPLHQFELRAYRKGNTVDLKWIAENEMNTSSFVIERSMDGLSFIGIGSKPPSGPVNTPTNYQFDDNSIPGLTSASIIHYRIKAMDNGSRFAYSNVTTVKVGAATGILVWPNPAGSFLNITYDASSSTTIDISLMNTQGGLVRQEMLKVSRGVNQFSMNDIGRLPAGIYLIRITDKNTGKLYTQKISK